LRPAGSVGAVSVGSFTSALEIVGAIFKNALYSLIFEVAAAGAFFFTFFGVILSGLMRGLTFSPIRLLAGLGAKSPAPSAQRFLGELRITKIWGVKVWFKARRLMD